MSDRGSTVSRVAGPGPDPGATGPGATGPAATGPATGAGPDPGQHARPARTGTALAVAAGLLLAGLAAAAALVGGGGAWEAPPGGLADAGALVGWALPLVLLAARVAAVLAVGWMVGAAFLDTQGARGVLSPTGRRDVVRAAWAAAAWAAASLAAIPLTVASVVGVPLSDALDPDVFTTYWWEIASNRAYAFAALAATALAVGLLLTSRTGATAVWTALALVAVAAPGLAAHGSALGDHSLAVTAGTAHVLAAVVWVGGLASTALHAWRGDPGLPGTVHRFGRVATVAVVVLAASGVGTAYTRLDSAGQLLTTGYGRLVVVKVALLGALAAVALVLRRRVLPGLAAPPAGAPEDRHGPARAAFARWAALEAGVMAVAVGVAVALARTPYPRLPVPLPSPAEELLGFEFPPEPSWATVVLGWHPDAFFLVFCALAAGLYVAGVVRLHRRGDRWSPLRTGSWLGGVAVVGWATNAGVAAYATVSFGYHMLSHMALSMMAPILLVLGAPITLALRALHPAGRGAVRGPREWLVWALHAPLSRFVTHPLWALAVFTVGLYGLYFTPLFTTAMSSHVGHTLMQVHFLLAGWLFYFVVIGVDPGPRQVPYWARLLVVLMAMVIHGFFALAIMMGSQPLGDAWYSQVRPPWIADPLADSFLGGGVAWAFGEIPTLVVLIALVAQWARSDEREARRYDRAAERDGGAELAAYNARLARLAEQDAREG